MHQCIKFILFWNDTLHVSDGLSVHHQQFQDCKYSNHTDTSVCLLASRHSSICLTHVCYCMYSLELLTMDGKTVRNM